MMDNLQTPDILALDFNVYRHKHVPGLFVKATQLTKRCTLDISQSRVYGQPGDRLFHRFMPTAGALQLWNAYRFQKTYALDYGKTCWHAFELDVHTRPNDGIPEWHRIDVSVSYRLGQRECICLWIGHTPENERVVFQELRIKHAPLEHCIAELRKHWEPRNISRTRLYTVGYEPRLDKALQTLLPSAQVVPVSVPPSASGLERITQRLKQRKLFFLCDVCTYSGIPRDNSSWPDDIITEFCNTDIRNADGITALLAALIGDTLPDAMH